MNARKLAGVRFESTTFTPATSTLVSKLCHGVKISIVDRNVLDSPALGIELAAALHKLYPKEFEIGKMMLLLANDAELAKLQKGDGPKSIVAGWQRSLRRFRRLRHQYLLYPELR
jgi:uncharacterized protein YbbC (DUF1343 family)